jgi:hypothetical protein
MLIMIPSTVSTFHQIKHKTYKERPLYDLYPIFGTQNKKPHL